MSRCSSLGEATAAAAEAENAEEITVLAELERALGQNPATSNGESHAVSPNADDDLGEGASDSAKSWMCYFGSLTIAFRKIKEMKRGVISRWARAAHPEPRPCRSTTVIKLLYRMTSLLPACACLRILP
jgi:hypothetical protein